MASAEEKLRKKLEEVALRENYKSSNIVIKPISSGGANYTTDLYLATISEPLKKDIHVFAKVANIKEEARSKFDYLAQIYAIEGMFYKDFVPKFDDIYNKNKVPAEDRLLMSKFYGYDLTPYEETIILENLEAEGFNNFDRMKPFSWEYASTGVTQLARFHALGFAIRDQYPAEIDKLSNMSNNIMFETIMAQFIELGMQSGMEVLNGEYKLRLEKFYSNEDLAKKMLLKLQDNTTLLHGDFRPSNCMHRRKNGKLEIIPLDYQVLRMGNPLGDLMHFIFGGSNEEFRKDHYHLLFDHYFKQLTLALQKLQIDVEKVYPKKKFESDVLEMQPYGLLLGMAMASVLVVAPEDAPEFDGDINNMRVKPNQLAQELIIGIAKDFIRWEVL